MKWKWNWCYLESYIAFSLIRQLKRTRDLLLQLNCKRRGTKWKFKIEWLKFETLEEERDPKLTGEGEFDRFDTEEAITGTHIGVIEAEKRLLWEYSRKCVLMWNWRERDPDREDKNNWSLGKMGLWLWWQGFSFFLFNFLCGGESGSIKYQRALKLLE
jgi:hypothetical protein